MKIVYQGRPGAYGHQASQQVAEHFNIPSTSIAGLDTFGDVWNTLDNETLAVLPIENSYAGSIHENLYQFLRHPEARIIGEIRLTISHCLLGLSNDIHTIHEVYSHPQALAQCHDFIRAHHIKPIAHYDTAWAAEMVAQSGRHDMACIASAQAGEIYGLNMLASGIQDQDGNTTRFFVVSILPELRYEANPTRTSILFEAADTPASLYKCLGAFATCGVNLIKIESIPSQKGPFTYYFWVEFIGTPHHPSVQLALQELAFFTRSIKILGEF